jgi:hypothetical protein
MALIIEAKAHGADDWEEGLSQAWLYATHPEFDVPFMAIADGSRIAVYDTFRPAWNEPVVEVTTARLAEDFESLAAVLGAENVTNAVRARRMRHLGDAMKAELSFDRLRQYVRDVERLADEAQAAVLLNQKAVIRDQFENEERAQREAVEARGLFAIAVWANWPFGVPRKLSGMARDHLLDVAAANRLQEFDRLRAAATYLHGRNGSPHPRMFWNLRFLELFICLSARDADGCASFSERRAQRAIRDHLLGFPDDPLNRAAHRLRLDAARIAELRARRDARSPSDQPAPYWLLDRAPSGTHVTLELGLLTERLLAAAVVAIGATNVKAMAADIGNCLILCIAYLPGKGLGTAAAVPKREVRYVLLMVFYIRVTLILVVAPSTVSTPLPTKEPSGGQVPLMSSCRGALTLPGMSLSASLVVTLTVPVRLVSALP